VGNHKDSLAASAVVIRKGSVEDNQAAAVAAAEAGIVDTAEVSEALLGTPAECHYQPEPSHLNDLLGSHRGCLAAAAAAVAFHMGSARKHLVVVVAAADASVVEVAEIHTEHRTAASVVVVVAAAPLEHHPNR